MNLSNCIILNGVEIAWDEAGDPDAPTLVICHGYGGSAHNFEVQTDALAASWRVVVYDQRGHGQSEKLGELDGYTADLLSADLNGLVEAVGGGPVTILGHSLGGRVALGALLARPELYRSLILSDTTAWSFRPEDEMFRDLIGAVFESFDPAAGVPNLEFPGPEATLIEEAMTPEWQARATDLAALADPYALKALGLELFSGDEVSVRDRLHEITCLVTVIVGEFDEPFAAQAPVLVDELPDAELVVISGGYHMPMLTHGEEWRRAVERHLHSVNTAG